MKYRLTTTDTIRLPRVLLFSLFLIYLIPGFLGRDPWKYDDAIGFGVVQQIISTGGDTWFQAKVAGQLVPGFSTIAFWPNAFLYQAFSWTELPPFLLSILGSLCWVALFFFLIWETGYAWGCLPEAQPEKLPFGGQPSPTEYAATLADGVFLLALSTVGWVTRFHEISLFAAQMCAAVLVLRSGAFLLENKILSGVSLFFVSILLLALFHSFIGAVLLAVSAIVSFSLIKPKKGCWLGIPLIGLLLLFMIDYFFQGYLYFSAARAIPKWSSLGGWEQLGRLADWVWVLWPACFLVLIFCLRYAKRWDMFHKILATYSLFILGLACLFVSDIESFLFLVIPSLLLLTVFTLPILGRAVISLLDSFAFVFFGGLILVLWVGWLAFYTGSPPGMTRLIAKWVPGFAMPFNFLSIIFAILLTASWGMVVIWRLRWHPRVLWRGIVLSASGVTVVWGLLSTLWLPAINHSRSYQDIALSVKDRFIKYNQSQNNHEYGAKNCVATEQLDLPQRAIFAYVGQLPLAFELKKSPQCHYLLIQDNVIDRKDDSLPRRSNTTEGKWVKVWEGRRVAEANWRYRLYHWKSNT